MVGFYAVWLALNGHVIIYAAPTTAVWGCVGVCGGWGCKVCGGVWVLWGACVGVCGVCVCVCEVCGVCVKELRGVRECVGVCGSV